jgi:hypothetical protein
MYIVQNRRLRVGHDDATDTPIYREVGDAVPEAETWAWQTVESYLRNGHIRYAEGKPARVKKES